MKILLLMLYTSALFSCCPKSKKKEPETPELNIKKLKKEHRLTPVEVEVIARELKRLEDKDHTEREEEE